jgi:hypothetical protein
MAIPVFLQALFNYLETVGVTDVANTITRIKSQALLLGWTNPSGDTILSPPNTAGQTIQLAFTRIGATNLSMAFTDSLGRTATRRCQPAATFTERIYFTQFSFFFDPGNGEGLWASILDATPDLQNSHDQTFAFHGSRTAADALDALFQTCGAMKLDAATPRAYVANVDSVFVPRFMDTGAVVDRGFQPFTVSGCRLWQPVWQEGISSGSQHRLRGRLIGCLAVSENEPAQTEIVVPLDEANSGLFKVLSFTNAGTRVRYKFACRRS